MHAYIRNKNGAPVGAFVASKREDGTIRIGYSLLHPKDAKKIREYNRRVKQCNGFSYHLRNLGIDENAPIEPYAPVFDRKKAVQFAEQNEIKNLEHDHSNLPTLVKDQFEKFMDLAAAHLKGMVVIE